MPAGVATDRSGMRWTRQATGRFKSIASGPPARPTTDEVLSTAMLESLPAVAGQVPCDQDDYV